jgi:hypothetical protein
VCRWSSVGAGAVACRLPGGYHVSGSRAFAAAWHDSRISADGGLVTHFGAPGDANSPLRQVSPQVAQRWIDAMSPIEPICFVHRALLASILFQSGRRDNLVRSTDAERLHAAAMQPKTIRWYDSGHDQGPAGQRDYLEWLHDKIGIRAP